MSKSGTHNTRRAGKRLVQIGHGSKAHHNTRIVGKNLVPWRTIGRPKRVHNRRGASAAITPEA